MVSTAAQRDGLPAPGAESVLARSISDGAKILDHPTTGTPAGSTGSVVIMRSF